MYNDSIFFHTTPDGGRGIEVSFFDATHVADPGGDPGYERKLIGDMHDTQDRVNSDVFAAENAATDGRDVRPLDCAAPGAALLPAACCLLHVQTCVLVCWWHHSVCCRWVCCGMGVPDNRP